MRMRLEIVEGLLRLHEQWSEVSDTVTASRDRADAIAKLQVQPFDFTELQAEHIMHCSFSGRTEFARSALAEERDALLEQLGW